MDLLNRAVVIPAREVVVYRASWRQVLGDVTPLASCAQNIHHTVHHFPHHHLAFRASEPIFTAAQARLAAAAIPFGNDPDDLTNGLSSDPLGGHGRIYFQTPDGHLFEICT